MILPVDIKYFLGAENPDSTRRTSKQNTIAHLKGSGHHFILKYTNTQSFEIKNGA